MFGTVALFSLPLSLSGVKDCGPALSSFHPLRANSPGYQNERVLVALKAKWVQLRLTRKHVTLISSRSLGHLCEEKHGIV